MRAWCFPLIALLSGWFVAFSGLASAETGSGFIPKGNTWSDWFVPGNPRVIETGIEVERWNGSEQFAVEWLDDRRIAFSEVIDPAMYEKYNGHEIPMPYDYLQIVFYDTVLGKKEIYKPGNLICLKNGRIAYRIVRPSISEAGTKMWQTFVYGEIGKEQPYQAKENEFINRFDCKIQQKLPDDKTGVPIRYLKREHGYIDVGSVPESRQRTARFVQPDGTVIELPFKGVNLGGIKWIDYWHGYQLTTGPTSPRELDTYQAANYLLMPDGAIHKLPVSTNRDGRIQTQINYYPIKTGALLFIQTPVDGGRMTGASGLYYDNGDSLRRVHRAFVSARYPALSPDGCRLPFSSIGTITYTYKTPAYLMILDACGTIGDRPRF